MEVRKKKEYFRDWWFYNSRYGVFSHYIFCNELECPRIRRKGEIAVV